MSVAAPSWGVQALWQALSPLLPGLGVEVVSSIASTNSALLERSRALPRENERTAFAGSQPQMAFGRRAIDAQPYLLVAEHQTAGRGRRGRSWRSAPGASLTFTLALPLATDAWSGLSLAVGVALAEALDPLAEHARPRVGLKWPNDLWCIDADAPNGVGRKLGGILVETLALPPARRAVIGVGINILPLAGHEAYELSSGCAALQEIWPTVDAPQALARIARPLVEAVQLFEQQGLAPFVERFAARDLLAGRAVSVSGGEAVSGTACGIAADGALQIETAAGLVPISSGEVSVRLQPCVAVEDLP